MCTPRHVPAAICYAKFRVLVARRRTRVVRQVRAARNASAIPFTPLGNPVATAERPKSGDKPKLRPRLSALARSGRAAMAEHTVSKKPRRTRQPTEKRLPVSSPARATEITLKGGSPSHSLARPHRVAARRESALGPRAPPATRPRRPRPLEAHAAPPAHPAGTAMSRTRAAAWKTPLAQPGRGAFA